jgi:hypothetical protein
MSCLSASPFVVGTDAGLTAGEPHMPRASSVSPTPNGLPRTQSCRLPA